MERASNDNTELGLNDDAIPSVALSVAGMQAVARRQLVGSVVVAILIAAVVALSATRPGGGHGVSPSHDFAVIQQPTLVSPPGAHVAARKHNIETP